MDLTKIVSISGKSGLFKVVSQSKNAVIVESLTDQKRFPAFGNEKMSSLEEISIFTTGEDRPLKEIFKAFHNVLQGKPAPDHKSDNKILVNFFLETVPDFDQERVYASDIRKMVNWYNALQELQMLDFTEPEEEKPSASTAAEEEKTESGTVTSEENPADDVSPETKPKARKKKTE